MCFVWNQLLKTFWPFAGFDLFPCGTLPVWDPSLVGRVTVAVVAVRERFFAVAQ